MSYEHLELQVEGRIALLTLNRPQALNALNKPLHEEIQKAFGDLSKDESLRAVIITGAGDKAFAAGADIEYMKGMGESEGTDWGKVGHATMNAIAACPRPTIAAVNGFALGGGLEVALACDILLASSKAKLGLPEVTLGLIPGWGGTQRLARRVGPGRAKQLVFSGNHIKADEALAIGLADAVIAPEDLMSEARKLAETIASRGPEAIRFAKEAIDTGMREGLQAGIDRELALFGKCFTTADTAEGIDAFLSKRKAEFQGK